MEGDSSYLECLNEAQRAAVEYLGGPELVIAGAGSGKTRVLTYKIVHLLHNGHRPSHIMALTFTNKAANEMRERIEKLTGPETASQLWMGSFHSIFSRILRRHADRIGFKTCICQGIYDEFYFFRQLNRHFMLLYILSSNHTLLAQFCNNLVNHFSVCFAL